MLITRPVNSGGIFTRCRNPAITTRSARAWRQAAKITSLHASTPCPPGGSTRTGTSARSAIFTPRTPGRLDTTTATSAGSLLASICSSRFSSVRPEPESRTASRR